MGEYRTCRYATLFFQPFTDGRDVIRLESQTVHSRVYLDMDRVGGDPPSFRFLNHGIQQAEAIYLRLQIVFKQDIETAELRIHYDNRD